MPKFQGNGRPTGASTPTTSPEFTGKILAGSGEGPSFTSPTSPTRAAN